MTNEERGESICLSEEIIEDALCDLMHPVNLEIVSSVQRRHRTNRAAQMATSFPIAKALLKDVRPPVSDDAIFDSLWHYWFDVDKAVGWLKKEWEKKG